MQRATAGMAPPPAPQPRFASDYVYHFAEAEPLPLINTGLQAGARHRYTSFSRFNGFPPTHHTFTFFHAQRAHISFDGHDDAGRN